LGNHLPAITDHSTGFWRRWDVVPFSVTIPERERDPLLANTITVGKLPGHLNVWQGGGCFSPLPCHPLPICAAVPGVPGENKQTSCRSAALFFLFLSFSRKFSFSLVSPGTAQRFVHCIKDLAAVTSACFTWQRLAQHY
jgi:hypothetical protein